MLGILLDTYDAEGSSAYLRLIPLTPSLLRVITELCPYSYFIVLFFLIS